MISYLFSFVSHLSDLLGKLDNHWDNVDEPHVG